jgi:hypothetical protein
MFSSPVQKIAADGAGEFPVVENIWPLPRPRRRRSRLARVPSAATAR